MAGRFPTLFVNVGHIHNYLDEIRPAEPIGVVANAMPRPGPVPAARPDYVDTSVC
jgi:hypothetical protein